MLVFLHLHWFTALWGAGVVVAAPVVWKWLGEYKSVASVETRIAAAGGGLWKPLILRLEGAKTAILMGMSSAFATAKDWSHTLFGLNATDLDPFKDSALLHTFFADGVALKIMAGLSFFAAILTLKGHLAAAKIIPAGAPQPPVA